MRILLDESVPKALGFELHGHFVRTVQAMGWSGISNGHLLARMAEENFDALITCDQNIEYQQRPELPVALIVLVARNNRVPTILALAPALRDTLPLMVRGAVRHIMESTAL